MHRAVTYKCRAREMRGELGELDAGKRGNEYPPVIKLKLLSRKTIVCACVRVRVDIHICMYKLLAYPRVFR